MSPRPKRLRKISNPPIISGFRPYGNNKNDRKPEVIFLYLEEYEAIRLCDYNMLDQYQASLFMDVSRPTLTRIYARGRQKIAEAIVLGKQIIIEGGKIYFDSEWFSCKECGCFFNNPYKQEEITECPLCKNKDFSSYEQKDDESEESMKQCNDVCICPDCGFEQPHKFGCPCKDEICPKCHHNMVRKGFSPCKNI